MTLNVQYGCGLSAPSSWVNFDASPTLRLQRLPGVGRLFRRPGLPAFPPNVRYGDIVRGLPIPLAACDAVYCSHVLEHLALEEFRVALANTFKILKPGGVFRLVLPDLEFAVRQYVDSPEPDAAVRLIRDTGLGSLTRSRSPLRALRDWMGGSRHLWMWDYKSLARELEQQGFTAIRRAEWGDSKLPAFSDVEDESRWHLALGIQASRP
jgi:SAM-dependent methyltransferase